MCVTYRPLDLVFRYIYHALDADHTCTKGSRYCNGYQRVDSLLPIQIAASRHRCRLQRRLLAKLRSDETRVRSGCICLVPVSCDPVAGNKTYFEPVTEADLSQTV